MHPMQQPLCWDPGIFLFFFCALFAKEKERRTKKKKKKNDVIYSSYCFVFCVLFSSNSVLIFELTCEKHIIWKGIIRGSVIVARSSDARSGLQNNTNSHRRRPDSHNCRICTSRQENNNHRQSKLLNYS